MFLKAIPFGVTITFFLVSDVSSKDIRQTSDFSKGYLNEFYDTFNNNDNENLNDIEIPMNEMEDPDNPGMVAVVVMKDKLPQIPQVSTPNFKSPERSPIKTIPLQEPVKVVDNDIDLTMGDDSNSGTSTSTSSELSGLDIDVNGIKDIDNTDTSKVQILRKALRSCSKKAFRRCKKACKAAYKITCADYYCSSRKKRALNRACKSRCRMSFN